MQNNHDNPGKQKSSQKNERCHQVGALPLFHLHIGFNTIMNACKHDCECNLSVGTPSSSRHVALSLMPNTQPPSMIQNSDAIVPPL